jgi:hypothetical protein
MRPALLAPAAGVNIAVDVTVDAQLVYAVLLRLGVLRELGAQMACEEVQVFARVAWHELPDWLHVASDWGLEGLVVLENSRVCAGEACFAADTASTLRPLGVFCSMQFKAKKDIFTLLRAAGSVLSTGLQCLTN